MTGIVGLEYNGNRYYYIKNLQDDIIGIVNSNNQQIVTYEYDSWGKVLSIKDSNGNIIEDKNHIGIINPYRYRSYYYDNETGLYYLNARYYHPEWKRFINADEILGANQDLNSYNLYAYCSNNPIVQSDPSGHGLWKWIKKKVGKVVKAVQDVKKKVTDFVGRVLTINKNTTKTNPDNKNYGLVTSHTFGGYTTTTKNITGGNNKDRTTSFEIGSETFKHTTAGMKYEWNKGSFIVERSYHATKVTINYNGSSSSYEFGEQGFDYYFRKSHGKFVSENKIEGYYNQYNLHAGIVPIIVFAGAKIKAAKKVIDVIGGLVNSVGVAT